MTSSALPCISNHNNSVIKCSVNIRRYQIRYSPHDVYVLGLIRLTSILFFSCQRSQLALRVQALFLMFLSLTDEGGSTTVTDTAV